MEIGKRLSAHAVRRGTGPEVRFQDVEHFASGFLTWTFPNPRRGVTLKNLYSATTLSLGLYQVKNYEPQSAMFKHVSRAKSYNSESGYLFPILEKEISKRGIVAGGLTRSSPAEILRPLFHLLSLGTHPGSASSRKDAFASNQS